MNVRATTSHATESHQGIRWTIRIGIVAVIGLGITAFFLYRSDGSQAANRSEAYQAAVQAGIQAKDAWPETPEALIREYWQAAGRKDYDRLLVLCPGSLVNDFKKYYDFWTPSPAQSVGAPEPHPQDPKATLYPVKVPFPGFPNKTVKMAVRKTADGRYVIDGRNTIWW